MIMAKEMVDQLNNLGEKIGVVDKDIAHKKGFWHRSIHVWLVNNDNKILFQHRCAEKKLFPNTWDCSFAGHISAGETPIQAVLREGKEEIGIDVDLDKLDFLFTNREMIKYKDINSNEFVDVYLLKQNFELDEMQFQKEEVSGAKYVSISDFYDMINKNEVLPDKVEYSILKEYLRK